MLKAKYDQAIQDLTFHLFGLSPFSNQDLHRDPTWIFTASFSFNFNS